MVGRGPIGKTVGRARRERQRIQDGQAVLQIADASRQGGGHGWRQIAPGTPEAVAPRLLAMAEVRFMGPLWRWRLPVPTISIQLIELMLGRTTTSRPFIGGARVLQRSFETVCGPRDAAARA
jgi:hypothetical protein